MLLSTKESFCAKTHIFFAKNVKNLHNINLYTIKQVFIAINDILLVKLVGIDTKIKVLSLKMQKLQPRMFILTTVHAIAPKNPLGNNFFQNLFCWCCCFSKMNTLNTGRRKIKIFGEKISNVMFTQVLVLCFVLRVLKRFSHYALIILVWSNTGQLFKIAVLKSKCWTKFV